MGRRRRKHSALGDRIDVNTAGNWTGPKSLLGAVDDLVIRDVDTVHLEAMSDSEAFLAIYKQDGQEVRVWLTARHESPTDHRTVLDMREEG